MTPEERFWTRVDTSGECWVFRGAIDRTTGYPNFTLRRGFTRKAHRVAWIITSGDPGELDVLHRCDNRVCVRPKHLYLGTAADNCADMDARGRRGRGYRRCDSGERHYNAKVTDAQMGEIAAAVSGGETLRSVGARYGISHVQAGVLAKGFRSRRTQLAATMPTKHE